MTQGSINKQDKPGPDKKEKENLCTKVVIRRLPPNLTKEQFLEHISPVPENDYCHFVSPDKSLGQHTFSRAYINFENVEDICIFCEKFDGYVFVDSKGNEYPAVVEYAPFQKYPKKRRRSDLKKGTIEQDSDYKKFLEMLENPQTEAAPPIEKCIEEIEAKEKELKANHGVAKQSTPLLDYIKRRKDEKRAARQRAIEERKRREMERRKLKEEERKKRREREKERLKEKETREESDDAPMKILRKDERKGSEASKGKEGQQKSSERSRGRDGDSYNDRERISSSHGSPHKEIRVKSSRDRDRPRDRDRDQGRYRDDREYRDTRYHTSPTKEKPEKYQSGEWPAPYREQRYKHYDKDRSKGSQQRDHKSSKNESKETDKELNEKPERYEKKDKGRGSSNNTTKNVKDSKEMESKAASSTDSTDSAGKAEAQADKARLRNKDRPERAIYVPGKRAAEKRKEEERRRERKQEEQKKQTSTVDK